MTPRIPLRNLDPQIHDYHRARRHFESVVEEGLATRLEGRSDHDAGSRNSILGHDPALTSHLREKVLERDLREAEDRASGLRLSQGDCDPTQVSGLRTQQIILAHAINRLVSMMGAPDASKLLAEISGLIKDEQYEAHVLSDTIGEHIDNKAVAKRQRQLEDDYRLETFGHREHQD